MINLKKHDIVADAVLEILQQEALKGNQHKIDANKNNKIDGEDFKILRGKKKVEEELKGNQHKIDANKNNKIDGEDFKILRGKKKVEEEIDMDDRTKDTLVGREKTKQKDDVGPNSNAKVTKFKLKSEEAEQIDELSKSTLGSYLDKKKSEYMKGKTQSGSKENAKDIQNMGKAHDKMKKEETQFNDHEKGAAQRLRDMGKNEKEAEKRDKRYQAMRNKKTLKQMKERLEEPVLDELINEVMSKDASAGDWIHDFVHSDNPKFAGKSKAKRKEMALAAYYSKKNEEAVNEGLKDMAKKTFKALTGGSDKDHLDRLKKDMYGGSEVKYAAKTLVKHAKDPLGLKKEETETVEEGWDDMVKAAQEKVKSGPKPSGGSGKKEGSRYGGSKQKEKPEQEVKEAKNPMMDAGVGAEPNFSTNASKPMQAAQTMAKKSLARMRSDMMAKSGK